MPSVVADPWWAPYRRYGETVVMHVEIAADETTEREAVAWLDEAERSRWMGYPYPGPRRRFGLCRSALRAILAAQLGCKGDEIAFGEGDRGKPFVLVRGRPAPVSFNVSHSGRHGLIAIAPVGRVGVDIEERSDRPYLDTVIEAVLSREERSEIEGLSNDLRLYSFYRLWTIKEAIIKAIGVGHRLDVASITVPASMRQGSRTSIYQSRSLPGIALKLEDMGNKDFAAALAYEIPN